MHNAVVILAGGRATRLPGKLEREFAGTPLLARVYQNVREFAPVVVAGAGSFNDSIDAMLDCPIVIDRWPSRGPLAGLLSACEAISAEHIFAVAGDAPNVTSDVLEHLAAAWQPGDEAVVPEHDGRTEPLAALYSKSALEREGYAVLASDDASMHALLRRLRVRRISLSADYFHNVNTVADLK